MLLFGAELQWLEAVVGWQSQHGFDVCQPRKKIRIFVSVEAFLIDNMAYLLVCLFTTK